MWLVKHLSGPPPSSPWNPSSSFNLKVFSSSGYISSIKMIESHARRSEVERRIDEDCLSETWIR
ncbi:hypothetical protein N665_1204s0002 [Sinapis alba]|nr:hypothetical protein N665_1204s0002 [Sinapis alba]